MANFCGQCGHRLDPRSGLCLECGKRKLRIWKLRLPAVLLLVLASTATFLFPKKLVTAALFDDIKGILQTKERTPDFPVFGTGGYVIGLQTDGTVKVAQSLNDPEQSCDFHNWTDIIDFYHDDHFTFGLKKDGSIVSAFRKNKWQDDIDNAYYYNLYEEVSSWTNVVDLYYDWQTAIMIGLHDDGTVSAVENYCAKDYDDEVKEISQWRDIVALSSGEGYILGVRSDGTVAATGFIKDGKNAYNPDLYKVCSWKDITQVCVVDNNHIAGLKKDGTVIIATGSYTGYYMNNEEDLSVAKEWTDISKLYSERGSLLGLKMDGTLLTAFSNDSFIQSLSQWKNLTDFYIDEFNAIGLKSDGTVVYSLDFDQELQNMPGESISQWKDIVAVSYSPTLAAFMGLRSDGTIAISYYPEDWSYDPENLRKEAIAEVSRWANLLIPERSRK